MPVGGNFTTCNCGPDTACENPSQPVASVGLCLADGTPIAVTVIRDCVGNVTSEGWINLVTGVWSAGQPPAGTIACGDSRSITTTGTFCDIDPDTGDVLGLVLVEYQYAADGSIASVRLVDAITGTTYTPSGEITTCPAGVEHPERDLVLLCDVDWDDQGNTTRNSFVRDYQRDETGRVTGHQDYDLDGQPYTPAGMVTVCQPEPEEPCASTVTVLRLCDLNPDVQPTEDGKRCATPFLRHLVYDCTGALVETRDTTMDGTTPYTPTGTVGTCSTPCEAQSVLDTCRWDDTDGDGVADTPYLELFGVSCDGALTSLGTYTEDLTGPYTPVSPVDPEDKGAPTAVLVEPHRIQLEPGQSWDASTVPLLQSVTVTAHGGNGQIVTVDGASTLFDGESVTWSLIRPDDAALTGPLTITAGSGTVTVSWTRAS